MAPARSSWKGYAPKGVRRYIVEMRCNGEVRYLYTRRVSLASVELARRFQHRKSAYRFARESEFCVPGVTLRVIAVTAYPKKRKSI